MTRYNELIANLKSGEVSPKYWGRKDLEDVDLGAELMNNFIPVNHGFAKRGGTEFIADVTSSATISGKGPALLPFIVSKTEAYTFMINCTGSLYNSGSNPCFRIYKNDGTEIVLTAAVFDVEAIPSDLDPKGFNYTQVGDVMWVTHVSNRVRPMIIVREGPNSFFILDYLSPIPASTGVNFDQIASFLKMPYRKPNISSTTMTPSATTGTGITITASNDFFDAGHVGTFIKLTHSGTTGVAYITGFTDAQNVTADVSVNFNATTATDNWEEGAWSTYRGYPKTIIVFEQRNIWGGNGFDVDEMWCSNLGNPFLMMQRRLEQDFAGDTSGNGYFIPTTITNEQQVFYEGVQILETDPFSFRLGSTEGNAISWLSSGRDIAAGTLGGEYIVDYDGNGFSIISVRIRKQTNYGGAPLKVSRVTNEVMYFTRTGQRFRSFKFNNENGSYVSADISILGEHLRKYGYEIFSEYEEAYEYKDMALQFDKDLMWFINSSNQLIGLKYSRETGILGWFRTGFPNPSYPLNGSDLCNIWGVTVIPNESGESDDLWLVVERENDLGPVFCIERIGASFDGDTLDEQVLADENIPLFLDSSLVIDNTAAATLTTIGGLSHLEGHTVSLVYRGEKFADKTVNASGQITLSASEQAKTGADGGVLMIGIPYEADFISIDKDAGKLMSTSEGQTQRIDRAAVRVYKSKDVRVGSVTKQYPLKLSLASNQALSSEIIKVEIPNSPSIDNRIRVKSIEPFPCVISSIAVRGMTND